MAELQEMGKYLLSLFHSVRMVDFTMARIYQRRSFERCVLSLFLVPKQHAQNSGSGGVIFLLHGYNANSLVRKYLYVKDTKITGNDINASSSDTAGSGSKMFALSAIYEY